MARPNPRLAALMRYIYGKMDNPEAELAKDELQAKTENISLEQVWRSKVVCIKGAKTGLEYFFEKGTSQDNHQQIVKQQEDMAEAVDREDLEDERDYADHDYDEDEGSLDQMDRETRNYEESRW
jgi:hypothetical protein